MPQWSAAGSRAVRPSAGERHGELSAKLRLVHFVPSLRANRKWSADLDGRRRAVLVVAGRSQPFFECLEARWSLSESPRPGVYFAPSNMSGTTIERRVDVWELRCRSTVALLGAVAERHGPPGPPHFLSATRHPTAAMVLRDPATGMDLARVAHCGGPTGSSRRAESRSRSSSSSWRRMPPFPGGAAKHDPSLQYPKAGSAPPTCSGGG